MFKSTRSVRLLLLAVLLWQPPLQAAAPEGECAILLHGLWRSGLSMKAVEWKLESAGYFVANISYPSITESIERLALLAVEEGTSICRQEGFSRVNFVTHSLGGILLREYLQQRVVIGLHRVVMMGPPNQGSQLADYVSSLEFLQPFSPQAIAQLGTGIQSVPMRLGPVDFTLGVIAGTANNRSLLPGFPDAAGDGTVTVEETRVSGMVDFIEMDTSHSFMMWNTEVLSQVLHFLRYGAFQRDGGAPPPAVVNQQ